MPPAAVTVAVPSVPPLQRTSVDATIAVGPSMLLMVAKIESMQSLASVIKTVYDPPDKLVAVAFVCIPGSSHRYVYGLVPPLATAVADPFDPPHDASTDVNVMLIALGSFTTTLAEDVQFSESVIVTFTVPEQRAVAVMLIWAAGSSHKYVNGEVPPEILAVASPSHDPKQRASVFDAIEATPAPISLITTVSVSVQPSESVTRIT